MRLLIAYSLILHNIRLAGHAVKNLRVHHPMRSIQKNHRCAAKIDGDCPNLFKTSYRAAKKSVLLGGLLKNRLLVARGLLVVVVWIISHIITSMALFSCKQMLCTSQEKPNFITKKAQKKTAPNGRQIITVLTMFAGKDSNFTLIISNYF